MSISLLPNVFTGNKRIPEYIMDNLNQGELYVQAKDKAVAEWARVLYVGMTRARDRVVTYVRARRSKGKDDNPMVAFARLGIDVALPVQDVCQADIFGTGIMTAVNPWPELDENEDSDECGWEEAGSQEVLKDIDTSAMTMQEYQDRYLSPSCAVWDAGVKVESAGRSGKRIALKGTPAMNRVGDCIHNSFAAFGDEPARNKRIAECLIKGFGFGDVLTDCQSIAEAYGWIVGWLAEHYGAASSVHHELPFLHVRGQQVVRGTIDFIWETTEGCVLIDFKTFPGKETDVVNPESKHYAGLYGAQFDCYRNAIMASGRNVLACYVYYPVAGLLVRLAFPPA